MRFIKDLIFFTIGFEILGTIFLSIIFYQNGESNVVWNGLFHSISAFCTAGFSLFPNSFEAYQGDFFLNLVIGVLSIGGALGFIVFTDIFEKMSGRKHKITFTSKIIFRFTFLGILLGTTIIFLSDENIANMTPERGLLTAFFKV
ncbi:MAG: potassium transporter TrkG [Saprospiraceae bacterium]